MTEEEHHKILGEEFPEASAWGFSVEKIQKIGFTLSHNKFYQVQKSSQFLEPQALLLTKEGDIVDRINPQNPRHKKFARYKTGIRDNSKKLSEDECIIIDLKKAPEDVTCVILFARLSKLQNLATVAPTHEGLQYSTVGVEDW